MPLTDLFSRLLGSSNKDLTRNTIDSNASSSSTTVANVGSVSNTAVLANNVSNSIGSVSTSLLKPAISTTASASSTLTPSSDLGSVSSSNSASKPNLASNSTPNMAADPIPAIDLGLNTTTGLKGGPNAELNIDTGVGLSGDTDAGLSGDTNGVMKDDAGLSRDTNGVMKADAGMSGDTNGVMKDDLCKTDVDLLAGIRGVSSPVVTPSTACLSHDIAPGSKEPDSGIASTSSTEPLSCPIGDLTSFDLKLAEDPPDGSESYSSDVREDLDMDSVYTAKASHPDSIPADTISNYSGSTEVLTDPQPNTAMDGSSTQQSNAFATLKPSAKGLIAVEACKQTEEITDVKKQTPVTDSDEKTGGNTESLSTETTISKDSSSTDNVVADIVSNVESESKTDDSKAIPGSGDNKGIDKKFTNAAGADKPVEAAKTEADDQVRVDQVFEVYTPEYLTPRTNCVSEEVQACTTEGRMSLSKKTSQSSTAETTKPVKQLSSATTSSAENNAEREQSTIGKTADIAVEATATEMPRNMEASPAVEETANAVDVSTEKITTKSLHKKTTEVSEVCVGEAGKSCNIKEAEAAASEGAATAIERTDSSVTTEAKPTANAKATSRRGPMGKVHENAGNTEKTTSETNATASARAKAGDTTAAKAKANDIATAKAKGCDTLSRSVSKESTASKESAKSKAESAKSKARNGSKESGSSKAGAESVPSKTAVKSTTGLLTKSPTVPPAKSAPSRKLMAVPSAKSATGPVAKSATMDSVTSHATAKSTAKARRNASKESSTSTIKGEGKWKESWKDWNDWNSKTKKDSNKENQPPAVQDLRQLSNEFNAARSSVKSEPCDAGSRKRGKKRRISQETKDGNRKDAPQDSSQSQKLPEQEKSTCDQKARTDQKENVANAAASHKNTVQKKGGQDTAAGRSKDTANQMDVGKSGSQKENAGQKDKNQKNTQKFFQKDSSQKEKTSQKVSEKDQSQKDFLQKDKDQLQKDQRANSKSSKKGKGSARSRGNTQGSNTGQLHSTPSVGQQSSHGVSASSVGNHVDHSSSTTCGHYFNQGNAQYNANNVIRQHSGQEAGTQYGYQQCHRGDRQSSQHGDSVGQQSNQLNQSWVNWYNNESLTSILTQEQIQQMEVNQLYQQLQQNAVLAALNGSGLNASSGLNANNLNVNNLRSISAALNGATLNAGTTFNTGIVGTSASPVGKSGSLDSTNNRKGSEVSRSGSNKDRNTSPAGVVAAVSPNRNVSPAAASMGKSALFGFQSSGVQSGMAGLASKTSSSLGGNSGSNVNTNSAANVNITNASNGATNNFQSKAEINEQVIVEQQRQLLQQQLLQAQVLQAYGLGCQPITMPNGQAALVNPNALLCANTITSLLAANSTNPDSADDGTNGKTEAIRWQDTNGTPARGLRQDIEESPQQNAGITACNNGASSSTSNALNSASSSADSSSVVSGKNGSASILGNSHSLNTGIASNDTSDNGLNSNAIANGCNNSGVNSIVLTNSAGFLNSMQCCVPIQLGDQLYYVPAASVYPHLAAQLNAQGLAAGLAGQGLTPGLTTAGLIGQSIPTGIVAQGVLAAQNTGSNSTVGGISGTQSQRYDRNAEVEVLGNAGLGGLHTGNLGSLHAAGFNVAGLHAAGMHVGNVGGLAGNQTGNLGSVYGSGLAGFHAGDAHAEDEWSEEEDNMQDHMQDHLPDHLQDHLPDHLQEHLQDDSWYNAEHSYSQAEDSQGHSYYPTGISSKSFLKGRGKWSKNGYYGYYYGAAGLGGISGSGNYKGYYRRSDEGYRGDDAYNYDAGEKGKESSYSKGSADGSSYSKGKDSSYTYKGKDNTEGSYKGKDSSYKGNTDSNYKGKDGAASAYEIMGKGKRTDKGTALLGSFAHSEKGFSEKGGASYSGASYSEKGDRCGSDKTVQKNAFKGWKGYAWSKGHAKGYESEGGYFPRGNDRWDLTAIPKARSKSNLTQPSLTGKEKERTTTDSGGATSTATTGVNSASTNGTKSEVLTSATQDSAKHLTAKSPMSGPNPISGAKDHTGTTGATASTVLLSGGPKKKHPQSEAKRNRPRTPQSPIRDLMDLFLKPKRGAQPTTAQSTSMPPSTKTTLNQASAPSTNLGSNQLFALTDGLALTDGNVQCGGANILAGTSNQSGGAVSSNVAVSSKNNSLEQLSAIDPAIILRRSSNREKTSESVDEKIEEQKKRDDSMAKRRSINRPEASDNDMHGVPTKNEDIPTKDKDIPTNDLEGSKTNDIRSGSTSDIVSKTKKKRNSVCNLSQVSNNTVSKTTNQYDNNNFSGISENAFHDTSSEITKSSTNQTKKKKKGQAGQANKDSNTDPSISKISSASKGFNLNKEPNSVKDTTDVTKCVGDTDATKGANGVKNATKVASKGTKEGDGVTKDSKDSSVLKDGKGSAKDLNTGNSGSANSSTESEEKAKQTPKKRKGNTQTPKKANAHSAASPSNAEVLGEACARNTSTTGPLKAGSNTNNSTNNNSTAKSSPKKKKKEVDGSPNANSASNVNSSSTTVVANSGGNSSCVTNATITNNQNAGTQVMQNYYSHRGYGTNHGSHSGSHSRYNNSDYSRYDYHYFNPDDFDCDFDAHLKKIIEEEATRQLEEATRQGTNKDDYLKSKEETKAKNSELEHRGVKQMEMNSSIESPTLGYTSTYTPYSGRVSAGTRMWNHMVSQMGYSSGLQFSRYNNSYRGNYNTNYNRNIANGGYGRNSASGDLYGANHGTTNHGGHNNANSNHYNSNHRSNGAMSRSSWHAGGDHETSSYHRNFNGSDRNYNASHNASQSGNEAFSNYHSRNETWSDNAISNMLDASSAVHSAKPSPTDTCVGHGSLLASENGLPHGSPGPHSSQGGSPIPLQELPLPLENDEICLPSPVAFSNREPDNGKIDAKGAAGKQQTYRKQGIQADAIRDGNDTGRPRLEGNQERQLQRNQVIISIRNSENGLIPPPPPDDSAPQDESDATPPPPPPEEPTFGAEPTFGRESDSSIPPPPPTDSEADDANCQTGCQTIDLSHRVSDQYSQISNSKYSDYGGNLHEYDYPEMQARGPHGGMHHNYDLYQYQDGQGHHQYTPSDDVCRSHDHQYRGMYDQYQEHGTKGIVYAAALNAQQEFQNQCLPSPPAVERSPPIEISTSQTTRESTMSIPPPPPDEDYDGSDQEQEVVSKDEALKEKSIEQQSTEKEEPVEKECALEESLKKGEEPVRESLLQEVTPETESATEEPVKENEQSKEQKENSKDAPVVKEETMEEQQESVKKKSECVVEPLEQTEDPAKESAVEVLQKSVKKEAVPSVGTEEVVTEGLSVEKANESEEAVLLKGQGDMQKMDVVIQQEEEAPAVTETPKEARTTEHPAEPVSTTEEPTEAVSTTEEPAEEFSATEQPVGEVPALEQPTQEEAKELSKEEISLETEEPASKEEPPAETQEPLAKPSTTKENRPESKAKTQEPVLQSKAAAPVVLDERTPVKKQASQEANLVKSLGTGSLHGWFSEIPAEPATNPVETRAIPATIPVGSSSAPRDTNLSILTDEPGRCMAGFKGSDPKQSSPEVESDISVYGVTPGFGSLTPNAGRFPIIVPATPNGSANVPAAKKKGKKNNAEQNPESWKNQSTTPSQKTKQHSNTPKKDTQKTNQQGQNPQPQQAQGQNQNLIPKATPKAAKKKKKNVSPSHASPSSVHSPDEGNAWDQLDAGWSDPEYEYETDISLKLKQQKNATLTPDGQLHLYLEAIRRAYGYRHRYLSEAGIEANLKGKRNSNLLAANYLLKQGFGRTFEPVGGNVLKSGPTGMKNAMGSPAGMNPMSNPAGVIPKVHLSPTPQAQLGPAVKPVVDAPEVKAVDDASQETEKTADDPVAAVAGDALQEVSNEDRREVGEKVVIDDVEKEKTESEEVEKTETGDKKNGAESIETASDGHAESKEERAVIIDAADAGGSGVPTEPLTSDSPMSVEAISVADLVTPDSAAVVSTAVAKKAAEVKVAVDKSTESSADVKQVAIDQSPIDTAEKGDGKSCADTSKSPSDPSGSPGNVSSSVATTVGASNPVEEILRTPRKGATFDNNLCDYLSFAPTIPTEHIQILENWLHPLLISRTYVRNMPKWKEAPLQTINDDMRAHLEEKNRQKFSRDRKRLREATALVDKKTFESWCEETLGLQAFRAVQTLLKHELVEKNEPYVYKILEKQRNIDKSSTEKGLLAEDRCLEIVGRSFGLNVDTTRGGGNSIMGHFILVENHVRPFLIQDQLISIQMELFGKTCLPTPDFLFLEPVTLQNGLVIRWIDSKASAVTPGVSLPAIVDRLDQQFDRYVRSFGPGMVIWRGGFPGSWVGRRKEVYHATYEG